nr:hypothetical protein [uncultured Desulfuromonas sp.]
MTFRHLHLLFGIVAITAITACTPPTFWQDKQQQQTFAEALDHYLSEKDRTALETIALSEPATPWTQRAQQLLNHLDTLEQQQQETVNELELNQQNCTNRLQLLQQENQDLKETMDQLKQLFIDMELRE